MATVWDFREQYIKFDSSREAKPEVMPVTGDGIPEGTILLDTAPGSVAMFVRSADNTWVEQ